MDFNFEFDAPSYFDFGNDDHDARYHFRFSSFARCALSVWTKVDV